MTGEELSETLAKNGRMKPETSTSTCFFGTKPYLSGVSVQYFFSLEPEARDLYWDFLGFFSTKLSFW
jgi:hypothetical protein